LGQLFRRLNGFPPPNTNSTNTAPAPASVRSVETASPSRQAAADTNLFMRTFKINTNLFYTAVQKALGTNIPIAPKALTGSLRDLFGRFGVDLAKPKALFFNDRLGLLFVKATGEDLTFIERVVESLNQLPPAAESRLQWNPPAVTNTAATADAQPHPQPVEKQWVLPKNPPSSANAGAATNLVYTGPGRQKIINQLDGIRLDSADFEGLPLSEVLRRLSAPAKLLDPEKQGINFLINPPADLAATGAAILDPATGLPLGGTAAAMPADQGDVGSTLIKVKLTDVRLTDVGVRQISGNRPLPPSSADW